MNRSLYVCILILIVFTRLTGTVSIRSELTGQGSVRSEGENFESRAGILWLPEFHGRAGMGRSSVDFLSAARLTATFDSRNDNESDMEFYRLWSRISGPFWDVRGGLQKITFGPAQLFRPLMWFDELSPTDPLGLTYGVYSLRGRVFFQNNTNFWGWVLYGNERVKGSEWFPTETNSAEYGGRIQFPVTQGEWGISCHSRVPDYAVSVYDMEGETGGSAENRREFRLGFDGQWDLITGLWFESVVTHAPGSPVASWSHDYVIGADYTFPLGSGVYLLAEFGVNALFDEDLNSTDHTTMAGMMMNYPINFFSTLSGFAVWLPDHDHLSLVASLDYTAGNFTFYLQFMQNLSSGQGLPPDRPGVPFDSQFKGIISWQTGQSF